MKEYTGTRRNQRRNCRTARAGGWAERPRTRRLAAWCTHEPMRRRRLWSGRRHLHCAHVGPPMTGAHMADPLCVDEHVAVAERSLTRLGPKSSAHSTCSSRRADSRLATRKRCATTPPWSPSAARCSGFACSVPLRTNADTGIHRHQTRTPVRRLIGNLVPRAAQDLLGLRRRHPSRLPRARRVRLRRRATGSVSGAPLAHGDPSDTEDRPDGFGTRPLGRQQNNPRPLRRTPTRGARPQPSLQRHTVRARHVQSFRLCHPQGQSTVHPEWTASWCDGTLAGPLGHNVSHQMSVPR